VKVPLLLRRTLAKLEASNRVEAVAIARRRGLVSAADFDKTRSLISKSPPRRPTDHEGGAAPLGDMLLTSSACWSPAPGKSSVSVNW
jgi:hypothetical protein